MEPIRYRANKMNAPQESTSDEHRHLESNQFNIWQRAITQEVKKTKAVETELEHFKYLCRYHADKAFKMEGLVWGTEEADKESGDDAHGGKAEEEVQLWFNPSRRLEFDGNCSRCRSRIANVVLFPCRHLCFCSECDNGRDACLICHTEKVFRYVTA
ncbi:hypothetical protein L1987_24907 [Smallanthus sonchifolius]|uniref:Uncharacterized protein n=1 Tax=Smallanthus sonchifolius TaxID=185202 RepID=A0ACB9IL12_9ASTR|nr:hypothetical protein L1987_24907 [Smallanthus sonchifolius]